MTFFNWKARENFKLFVCVNEEDTFMNIYECGKDIVHRMTVNRIWVPNILDFKLFFIYFKKKSLLIVHKIALIIYSIVLTMGSKDLAMRAQCCSGDGQA